MKKVTKIMLGALMLAGVSAAAATSADARVSVGIGIGGPVYGGYAPYYASYSCDPYSRWYDPYRCDRGYYYGGYGPSFVIGGRFGGGWHGGGFHGGGFHGGGFHGGGHHR